MAEAPEQTEKKPICFVIMPISDAPGYEPGHFGRVYEHLLKPAIVAAGYEPKRADDTVKTDYIVVGIIRMIVECEMVLCDISAKNPNVMYELGIRHAFNKPVVLVKDMGTEKMFDIQGLRYTEYNESLRIDSVNKDIGKITNSVRETANTPEKDTNSIVHLAGIKTAEVPPAQTISPDTQLILSAFSDLERKVDVLQNPKRQSLEVWGLGLPKSTLSKGQPSIRYEIGNKVYQSGEYLGQVTSFHENGRRVIVTSENGKKYVFDAASDSFAQLVFKD